MHYAHYPEPITGQRHTNLLGGFPKGRVSDGFAWFDVTRDDAQPTVLESCIASSDKKYFVSP